MTYSSRGSELLPTTDPATVHSSGRSEIRESCANQADRRISKATSPQEQARSVGGDIVNSSRLREWRVTGNSNPAVCTAPNITPFISAVTAEGKSRNTSQ